MDSSAIEWMDSSAMEWMDSSAIEWMESSAIIISAVQFTQKFIDVLSSTATFLVHIVYTVSVFRSRT